MIECAAAARLRACRGALIALAVSLLGGLLGGCSSLSSLLSPAPEQVNGPAAAASAPINSERAEYRIDVQAPDALRGMLLNYLDLARFQDAPATEGINAAELERLVRAAPAQARGLLETEGYFNADVKVTRESGPNGLPLLRVVVDPGPRTTSRRSSSTRSSMPPTRPPAAGRSSCCAHSGRCSPGSRSGSRPGMTRRA